MKNNWVPEYKNIVKLYKNNLSTIDIAKIYNTNKSIIRRIILKTCKLRSPKEANNLKIKSGKVVSHKSKYKKIIKMYKDGLSPFEISEKIFITQRVVESIIRRTIGLRSKSEAMQLAFKKGRCKNLINKGDIGPKSLRWIPDRSKIKWERGKAEEDRFFKKVIAERNYTCELTGERGGKLSVHHIIPVWKNELLRYSKSNVIVIKKSIHKLFHYLYGFKSDECDWTQFLLNKEYLIIKKEEINAMEIKCPKKMDVCE